MKSTFYCPDTSLPFDLDVDTVKWINDEARIDCPVHEQPGRHSITIGRPVAVGFGSSRRAKLEVVEAVNGEFYWKLLAANGEPVATHQMHRGAWDAERSAAAMLRAAADILRQRGWTVEEPEQ